MWIKRLGIWVSLVGIACANEQVTGPPHEPGPGSNAGSNSLIPACGAPIRPQYLIGGFSLGQASRDLVDGSRTGVVRSTNRQSVMLRDSVDERDLMYYWLGPSIPFRQGEAVRFAQEDGWDLVTNHRDTTRVLAIDMSGPAAEAHLDRAMMIGDLRLEYAAGCQWSLRVDGCSGPKNAMATSTVTSFMLRATVDHETVEIEAGQTRSIGSWEVTHSRTVLVQPEPGACDSQPELQSIVSVLGS